MILISLAKLTFEPPDWPIFLSIIAVVLLGWEVAGLFRYVLKRVRPISAVVITLSGIIAGVVLVVAGIFVGVMTASTRMEKRLRGLTVLIVGGIGTLIAGMGWLIWVWPCEGSLVTIAGCMSLWAVRSYAKTTSPLPRMQKIILLTIRITVILLLVGWVMRPTLSTVQYETDRPVILFGVDTSESMRRVDAPANFRQETLGDNQEPVSRIKALSHGVMSLSYLLDALTNQCDLQWFAFSSFPTLPVEYHTDDEAVLKSLFATKPGSATGIGDSLQTVFDPLAASGRCIENIVLFSDGCNNTSAKITPEKFAMRMSSRGVGVYTVGVGSDKLIGKAGVLSLRTTGAPDSTRAFGKMNIRPSLEAIGLQGRTIKVTCSFAGKSVASQMRKITLPKTVETFDFSHVPLHPGFRRLIVRVEVVGKKPRRLAGRAEIQKLVQVTDRQMRILYVEGKFRYEGKYIARALSGGRFVLDRRILLQPLRQGPSARHQLGEKLEDWLKYHAIIFGDVSPDSFTKKQLEIIKRLVGEYGKGFCMIGGDSSFGAGGWGKTPVADIMPVDITRSRRQIRTNVKPVPTADGLKSELMQLDANSKDIKQQWSQLPPMPGANLLVGVKPGAVVLAETQLHQPMIVTQNYGKGRTMGIAFDTTWKWVLSPGLIDTRKMQERFWRQVALYLAAPKGNVWIHTNRTTYDLDLLKRGVQEVEVTSGLEDPRGKPISNPDVSITLITPGDKKQKITLQHEGYTLRGILPPLREKGVYRLEITGVVGGKKLSSEHRFEVSLHDVESSEVLGDFNLLKRMAKSGGGEFYPLAKLDKLLANLQVMVHHNKRPRVTTVDVMSKFRWNFLVALIALLCTEWVLRKHSSLV